MVNGGLFDISTPYFEGKMEMAHLPVPPALKSNVEFHYYESGHMAYLRPEQLKELHDNVADFIRRTNGGR
jgi:carboxypeptidase C (cathepsin A)